MTQSKLIESEIADFFAGFGGPGEPDIQSGEAQRQLTERLLSVLALRERAEPVAYISKADLDAGYPHILARKEYSKACPMAVYSAPPAPVVPDELLTAMEEVLRISDRQHDAWDKAKAAVSACRAAMLQGAEPVSNAYKFPEGWVAVPVEPTKEMCDIGHIGVDVLTGVTEDNEYYSINGPDAAKVYRAMLAAAPDFWEISNSSTSDWIKCSERMPDEGAEVYIFCDGEWVLEAQYRQGDFYDVVRDGSEVFETVARCVSHWQPRPQKPAAPGKDG